MTNSLTELHIFHLGSVSDRRDVKKILELYVHLIKSAIDTDFLIMDDNAWTHGAYVVSEFLQTVDITPNMLATLLT